MTQNGLDARKLTVKAEDEKLHRLLLGRRSVFQDIEFVQVASRAVQRAALKAEKEGAKTIDIEEAKKASSKKQNTSGGSSADGNQTSGGSTTGGNTSGDQTSGGNTEGKDPGSGSTDVDL